MKKTLTLLLAAAATSAVYAQDASNKVIFSQSWTADGPSSTNSSVSNSSVSESFYYASPLDYAIIGTYNGSKHKPWAEGLSGGTTSFTLSFDLKNIDVTAKGSPWCDIFSMKLSNGSKMQFQITDSGSLALYNTIDTSQIVNTTLTLDSFANWTSFALIGDAEASKLSIYINGECVASTSDGAWTGASVTDIQFGAEFAPTEAGADRVPDGAFGINNITLTNGIILPTPEPTTATLSLLALAGLCARRRRK